LVQEQGKKKQRQGDWREPNNSGSIWQLQEALHAKAKNDHQPLVSERMNSLERNPDTRNGHVRFDERGVETSELRDIQTPATERAGPSYGPPSRHRATPRLHKFKGGLFSLQGPDGEARAKAHTRSGLTALREAHVSFGHLTRRTWEVKGASNEGSAKKTCRPEGCAGYRNFCVTVLGGLDGQVFYKGAGLTPLGKEAEAKVGQMLASAHPEEPELIKLIRETGRVLVEP
jgi:hypothetical protein